MTNYLDIHVEDEKTLTEFTDLELSNYSLYMGEDISTLEKSMSIAAKVLEQRGTTVEQVLEKEREKQSDKT